LNQGHLFTRTRHLVLAYIAGAVTVVVLLLLAVWAAPEAIDSHDVDLVLAAALVEPLNAFQAAGRKVIYVKSNMSTDTLATIATRYASPKLLPWAQRPKDHGCTTNDPNLIVMAPCERDDFVSAQVLSFPVWRTAVVSVGTSNTAGQLILLKFAGRWRVVKDRTVVF
jgi:hypothetical protein